MKVHLLTIFPELFGGPLATGPIRIAREKGALDVAVHDLRDYTTDKHLVDARGGVDHPPAGEEDDAAGHADRREAVGDEQRRAAPAQVGEVAVDLVLEPWLRSVARICSFTASKGFRSPSFRSVTLMMW